VRVRGQPHQGVVPVQNRRDRTRHGADDRVTGSEIPREQGWRRSLGHRRWVEGRSELVFEAGQTGTERRETTLEIASEPGAPIPVDAIGLQTVHSRTDRSVVVERQHGVELPEDGPELLGEALSLRGAKIDHHPVKILPQHASPHRKAERSTIRLDGP